MRKYLYYIWLMSAALLVASCSKQEVSPDNGDKIAFYVKSQQAVTASSRALIENTEYLLNNGENLPLYVTDEVGGVFSNTEVEYVDNGVWRSSKEWQEGKQYTFYAYIASPKVYYEDEVGVYVSPGSNGRIITIKQPDEYQENVNGWVDYMMSYRVSANGANKGLVKLDMERVTACVELYMAKSANITEVTVNSISFNNILTKASFSLQYHAAPGDNEGLYGMKNTWIENIFGDSKQNYVYTPTDENNDLINVGEDRFSSDHLMMKFLVVPQNLRDGVALSIDYTVNENGTDENYSSEFILYDYNIKSWDRGHKIRYFIGIDTSVRLEGYVEPWKSVDYIETTLLPND